MPAKPKSSTPLRSKVSAEPAPAATKQSQLISLLGRDNGASLEELSTNLGWLPHTTRAALAGLRKKGHPVSKDKIAGVTRYHIGSAA